MNIVDPSARDTFREEQIRAIEAGIRREYAKRIRAAKSRAEKKALRAERDAEIVRRTEPIIRERRPFLPPGHCQSCGYNLTGNVSGVCPECGTSVALSLETKPIRDGVILFLTAAMLIASFAPLSAFGMGWRNLGVVALISGGAAFVEFGCCVGWIVLGPRHLRHRNRQVAKVVAYLLATLSLCIGAFWGWIALVFACPPQA
jgi:predicted Zn-ribbon and HTH transcriptional regulator